MIYQKFFSIRYNYVPTLCTYFVVRDTEIKLFSMYLLFQYDVYIYTVLEYVG